MPDKNIKTACESVDACCNYIIARLEGRVGGRIDPSLGQWLFYEREFILTADLEWVFNKAVVKLLGQNDYDRFLPSLLSFCEKYKIPEASMIILEKFQSGMYDEIESPQGSLDILLLEALTTSQQGLTNDFWIGLMKSSPRYAGVAFAGLRKLDIVEAGRHLGFLKKLSQEYPGLVHYDVLELGYFNFLRQYQGKDGPSNPTGL